MIVKKYVYYIIYRCSQGMKDILNIADIVLKKFENDEPNITKCFVKSDNAECQHGNVVPEALFKVCQKNGVNLLRYDFNEPCKGKNQCDRESATSKSLMSSYNDAGSDIIIAEDIYIYRIALWEWFETFPSVCS